MSEKIEKYSIRFFEDKEVRAVWGPNDVWYFNIVDICAALSDSDNPTGYWRVLKSRLLKAGNQTVTNCNAFKFLAPDGKRRLMDAVDSAGIIKLAADIPSRKSVKFLEWFTYSDNTIDGQSKKKAYTLFESSLINEIEVGTVKGLQQIHAYIFGGLYDYAGKIRDVNISKGGFAFAPVKFLDKSLKAIEALPETTFELIVEKYVEMNVAHPFRDGNGRSTRIWLDLMLKKSLKKCVDWSKVDKKEYLTTMQKSVSNSALAIDLLRPALTDKIHDREMFMKGIDYSYYYEETTDTDDDDK